VAHLTDPAIQRCLPASLPTIVQDISSVVGVYIYRVAKWIINA